MKWQTHAVIGVSSIWLIWPVIGGDDSTNIGVLAACAALGALMPDLDASESKIKHLGLYGIKPFILPAFVAYRRFGHRGLLHSVLGLATFAATLSLLLLAVGWHPVAALILGYASHLAADSCTVAGIPALYPRKGHYFLLPSRLRIVTGSDVEEIFFATFACFSLILLLSNFR
jgi:inner membrane protein